MLRFPEGGGTPLFALYAVPHNKVPDGYPLDQYWKGESPKEDYNYLHVEVKPGQPTKFTINRFRPWSAEPFATVELFGSSK